MRARLQVADCERRFGKIPNPDPLSLLGVVEISEQQAELQRDGTEIPPGYSVRCGRAWTRTRDQCTDAEAFVEQL